MLKEELTDVKYPFFVQYDADSAWRFIEEEDELIQFCVLRQLDPRVLRYHGADPIYAEEGVYINADELEIDGELDEEVQRLIDEFQQKLREIKRPIIYNAQVKLLLVQKQQLEAWYRKVFER